MGTINYKTSDYITLAIKPYDTNEMIEEIKENPDDFYIDEEDLEDDDFLYERACAAISDMYDDDRANAESILRSHSFDYFDIKIEPGYYEGLSIDIDTNFDFYDLTDKDDALAEVDELKDVLEDLAGCGYVACSPGWSTGYADYNKTLKEIFDAVKKMKKDIENTELSESRMINEASAYNAKLQQFLNGQQDEVVKWVKKVLNNVFLGIKKDFDGYQEGKRPTIKTFGDHKIFKMTIQAQNDVKTGSNDVKGKWNFHDPIKDYCANLGTIANKKFDGNDYKCVLFTDSVEDLTAVRIPISDYEKKTNRGNFPMVGCYMTGIGGSYKNLTKDIAGNTYSIIVSVPMPEADKVEYKNPFMTKNGMDYTFSNDYSADEDKKDSYTVTYDSTDGEFVIREYREDSADRFTIIYKGSRNPQKAFVELVDKFGANTSVGEVERILTSNGLRVQHSWWFNPWTD